MITIIHYSIKHHFRYKNAAVLLINTYCILKLFSFCSLNAHKTLKKTLNAASLKQFQDSLKDQTVLLRYLHVHPNYSTVVTTITQSKHEFQCRSLLPSGGTTNNVLLTIKTGCTIMILTLDKRPAQDRQTLMGECYYTGPRIENCGLDSAVLGYRLTNSEVANMAINFPTPRDPSLVTQAIKKLPALYGSWSFINISQGPGYTSVKWIQSMPYLFNIPINIILTCTPSLPLRLYNFLYVRDQVSPPQKIR